MPIGRQSFAVLFGSIAGSALFVCGTLAAQDAKPAQDESARQQSTSSECKPSDGLACWGQPQSNPNEGSGVVLNPRASNDGSAGQPVGVVRRFGPVVPAPSDRAPTRAARVDQETSAACMDEQVQRDRENVPGEGPVCRSVRLAREGSTAQSQGATGAPVTFSLSPTSPVSNQGQQQRATRERKCETLPNGSLRCTSRSIYATGTSEGAASEAERRLQDRFED